MGNLFQEFKRRKVFRVAAVYAVVAWADCNASDEFIRYVDQELVSKN